MNVGTNGFLFCDIVERIRARRNLTGTPREINQIKMAVQDAYRTIPNHHNWKFYTKRLILQSSPIEEFEVDYDHTGGDYERLVTISSGTLPSWLTYGYVSYGKDAFFVDRVIDDERFTLKEGSNPGEDLSGVDVVLVRDAYPMPNVIRNINEVWCTSAARRLSYYPEAKSTGYSRLVGRYGTAMQYSLRSSNVIHGQIDFVLIPAQSTEQTYEVNANVFPRPLFVYESSGSDGSSVDGSGVFTSGTANFTSGMVGSVLRVSPNGQLPRANIHYDESRVEWEYQFLITKVNSATELEFSGTNPGTLTDRGYVISDLVDIHPEVHLDLLEADALRRFCKIASIPKEDKAIAEGDFIAALRNAIAADSNINWSLEYNTNSPWVEGFFHINPYAPHNM